MPLVCPSCGRTIAIRDVRPGRFRVPCPDCGRPFLLEVGDGPEPILAARPIGPHPDPVETPSPPSDRPEAWDLARQVLGRIGSALRVRAGWAWRAILHRNGLVGGTLILRELGRTSRGAVATGRQVLLGRDVIVRTLPADWGGADPVARARAEREAFAAGEVVHPNLVRRLDFGEDRGRRFAVEEPIDGPTLASLAGRPDRDGGVEAISVVLHAARGLQASHAQGMAHGDPSPEHVWLDAGGVVKLAGLGLGDTGVASRDGPPPFELSAAMDVQALGQTLETLSRSLPAGVETAQLIERMRWAGTAGGVRDLAEAIDAMERSLGLPTGQTCVPREEEAARFRAAVAGYRDVPLASIRGKLVVGFLVSCAAFAVLFARARNYPLAGGVLGLSGMTFVAYALIRAGLGGRAGLFGRVRELVVGGRTADWMTVLAAVVVGVGLLVVLGWLGGWIALGIVAVLFAVGVVVGLDAPIARDREGPLAEARDFVAGLRKRGVSEVGLREYVCNSGGDHWEPMFEALFGLEATRRARDTWGKAHPGRLRLDGWRFVALDWIEGRLRDRREAKARSRLEPVEERALVAAKVNEMTARRKSRRIAEALIVVGREVRAASLAATAPEAVGGPIRVTPRPIPDLIREAVETPDRLLTTTWSDDREAERGPSLPVRFLSAATGPRVRFLLGGLSLALFLLWADHVAIISSTEIRARAEEAIAGRDIGKLGGVSVDIDRARDAAEPLLIPGVPPSWTRLVAGYGVGSAGLILVASSFVAGSRIAVFALAGAAIAWFGPMLGLPGVGPISAPALASAIGVGLFTAGLLFRGRS